jgi:hypothetical protein
MFSLAYVPEQFGPNFKLDLSCEDEKGFEENREIRCFAYEKSNRTNFSVMTNEMLKLNTSVEGKITSQEGTQGKVKSIVFDKNEESFKQVKHFLFSLFPFLILLLQLITKKEFSIVILAGNQEASSVLSVLAHFDISLKDSSKSTETDSMREKAEEEGDKSQDSPGLTSSEEDAVILLPKKRKTANFLQNTRKTSLLGEEPEIAQFYGFLFEDNEVVLPSKHQKKTPIHSFD